VSRPFSNRRRRPALAILALLTSTLVLVGGSQAGWFAFDRVDTASLAASSVAPSAARSSIDSAQASPARLLSFNDLSNGSVEVIDASKNTRLELIPAGEGAFLRGVLRALTRERRLKGYDRQQPFELRVDASNGLLLLDTATGTTLLLNAFGPQNTASFARLLPLREAT
jgi:putative photosynthetic complex assembly protein